MRRKIRRLKKLFLTIAESSLINWIIFFAIIVGIVFNIIPVTGYKIMLIIVCLEVLILDANKFYL